METQRNSDVRATERIFKKVVYPGLETLRVVDRNGVPISYPGFNSVRSKSFILSPRGVPMKTPNHIYSGYHSHQAKVSDLIERPQSPENYYGPEKTFLTQPPLGSNSAKLPRKNNESPLLEKKRATTSQSAVPKHKGASSDHFLTSESPEKRILNSANSNYWNLSNQGLRLQREWTSLSNTRSIKRASEIVNHRVDRMYFMSGNSIKLKPRYDVDDEELSRMKEMQAKNKETAHKRSYTRTSSRSSIKSGQKKKEPIDLKKTMEATESEVTGDQTTTSEAIPKKPDGTISPINGWESQENKNNTEEHVFLRQKSLHEDDKINEKSDEIVINGDAKENDMEGMRADGRIDSSDLHNKELDVTVNDQGEANQEEEGEANKDEQGETNDENVAQETT